MSVPNTLPTLSAGAHRPDSGKACVMEYVSLLAGEEWSDTPTCTYEPLARAAQHVNDRLTDDERHLLIPLIGRLFGTTLPVDDRVFALRLAGTVEHLSPAAQSLNTVTERFLAGDATVEELGAARKAYASYASYAASAASYAASASAAAYAYGTAYAYAFDPADTATYVASAAASAAADADLVAWLSSIIDIYDDLSGRVDHREITDADLEFLAEMVSAE